MKKKFEAPELIVVLFDKEDIITTSVEGYQGVGEEGQEGGDYFKPF